MAKDPWSFSTVSSRRSEVRECYASCATRTELWTRTRIRSCSIPSCTCWRVGTRPFLSRVWTCVCHRPISRCCTRSMWVIWSTSGPRQRSGVEWDRPLIWRRVRVGLGPRCSGLRGALFFEEERKRREELGFNLSFVGGNLYCLSVCLFVLDLYWFGSFVDDLKRWYDIWLEERICSYGLKDCIIWKTCTDILKSFQNIVYNVVCMIILILYY